MNRNHSFKTIRALRCIALALLLTLPFSFASALTAADISLHPYTDSTDGTTFMVPDGWIEDTSPQSGFNCISSYIVRPDTGRKVIFLRVSMDDWANGRNYASSRTEYDNLMNTQSNMSMNYGWAKIEEVDFNGVTYFRYKSQDSTWQYFRYHNAVLHMFQFDVDTDDPYYPYFEAIMNSVVFPAIN